MHINVEEEVVIEVLIKTNKNSKPTTAGGEGS